MTAGLATRGFADARWQSTGLLSDDPSPPSAGFVGRGNNRQGIAQGEMKVKKDIMPETPEHYHLQHGEAKRDKFKEKQMKFQDMLAKAYADKLVQLAKSTFGGASSKAVNSQWGGHEKKLIVNGLSVSYSLSACTKKSIEDELSKKHPELAVAGAKRRALCELLNSNGARRFGAFFRTKYGKKTDAALIPQAHEEWVVLISSCER